jgi:hypothetical protein
VRGEGRKPTPLLDLTTTCSLQRKKKSFLFDSSEKCTIILPKNWRFKMNKNVKIFTVLIAFLMLVFLFNQCGSSEEEPAAKEEETTQAAVKETQQQPEQAKEEEKPEQVKSILPKRLLKVDLTDEQKAKCEAAHKEIFTPEILAKKKEFWGKLKGLEKGSEEFKTLKKQMGEEMKPYNKQFNTKLKEILTEEQKAKYFKKRKKKEEK